MDNSKKSYCMTPEESAALMRFQGGYAFTEAPPVATSFPETPPPFAGEATPLMARADRNLTLDDYQLVGKGLAPSAAVHPPIDNFDGAKFYEQADQNIWQPLKRKPLRD